MTRHRVLVTTAWLRPGDDVHHQLESAGCEVVHSSSADRAAGGENLADLVADVDGILAGTDPFTAEVFAAAPALKVLGRSGVGVDNIDVGAATRHGVAVCTTPGVNGQSVAEHTMGLLLSIARGIPQNVAAVRAGEWNQGSGRELRGATLGIVGLGAIGTAVATIARGFGMSVVAHDPFADRVTAEAAGIPILSLDELLTCSDAVSLHTFLSSETHHLIDAAALSRMKPGAFVINTARGGVIDEDALADALASGRLAGAALDTTEIEPLPAASRLRGMDNVIVTAHVAAATVESRARSGSMAARSVLSVLGGEMPEHVVNPEVVTASASR